MRNESQSFLNAIGSAEWNKNIESTVHDLLRKVEEPEYSSNLEEYEIKNYISEVLKELKKDKDTTL